MATAGQELGDWGEQQVARLIDCQTCHARKLATLKNSFPSLDLICRGCGAYMAQVKTVKVDSTDPDKRPIKIRGAGWAPLQVQFALGNVRDLYVVGALPAARAYKLAWIDRVPGQILLANAQVFLHRVADIKSKARTHEMYDLDYSGIPSVGVMRAYQA